MSGFETQRLAVQPRCPPPSHRTKGYLCSFPITWTPLSREKDIPPYLGYWLPLAITKTPPFLGFLGKSSRDYGLNIPPISQENGNTHAAPSCIRVGGRGFNIVLPNAFPSYSVTPPKCKYRGFNRRVDEAVWIAVESWPQTLFSGPLNLRYWRLVKQDMGRVWGVGTEPLVSVLQTFSSQMYIFKGVTEWEYIYVLFNFFVRKWHGFVKTIV